MTLRWFSGMILRRWKRKCIANAFLVADVNVNGSCFSKKKKEEEKKYVPRVLLIKRYNFLQLYPEMNFVEGNGKRRVHEGENEFSRIVLLGNANRPLSIETEAVGKSEDFYKQWLMNGWKENSDISVGTTMISSANWHWKIPEWMSVKAPSLLIAFQKETVECL